MVSPLKKRRIKELFHVFIIDQEALWIQKDTIHQRKRSYALRI